MNKKIGSLISNQIIRYLFFGVLTTLVNLLCYTLLSYGLTIEKNISNIISVVLAIIFAYVVNAHFVFESSKNIHDKIKELAKFFSVRLFSMVIEVSGFFLMYNILKIHDSIAKISIQFIIVILNYLFSKKFVFIMEKNEKTI